MRPEVILYKYWEHAIIKLEKNLLPEGALLLSKYFGTEKKRFCYQVVNSDSEIYTLKADYYIGVDWIEENHSAIVISPKLNSRIEIVKAECKVDDNNEIDLESKDLLLKGREVEIDYFAMLNKCLATDFLYAEIDRLVQINWESPEITIEQKDDFLSPLLIVKFLNVLKPLVQKGLRKSYYQTRQNLNSKVKGKILISSTIKQNVLKNEFTKTYCQFAEFGVDSLENRLLKKALIFSAAYIDNHRKLFKQNSSHAAHIINFCKPAFELVNEEININEIANFSANPFFKEYREAILMAKMILRKFSYSISNVSKEKITTPPFWIDMPKLFELYAYYFLKQRFSAHKELHYQFNTYGNHLDFLVNSQNYKMVVDAKYKPIYIYGKNHDDMRQVSGYARLEKIYKEIAPGEDTLIDCLIIYPDVDGGLTLEEFSEMNLRKNSIKGYNKIFKVGIKLPEKNINPTY